MVEQLFIFSMDVYIDSIGVVFFTITIQDLLVLKLVLQSNSHIIIFKIQNAVVI